MQSKQVHVTCVGTGVVEREWQVVKTNLLLIK